VPFFFKQWGGPTPKAGGRLLDGQLWDQMPGHATAVTPPAALSSSPPTPARKS
jgi:hypothetical protein